MADAVVCGKDLQAKELAEKVLKLDIPILQAIDMGFVAGMKEVGDKFGKGEYFVPDLLMSARAMRAGLDVLLPKVKVKREAAGKVVMGTVEGDIHDIGKTIVQTFFQTADLEVIDVGVDVPSKKFIDVVKNQRPNVLGMSCLLTVAMEEMGKVTKGLKDEGLREKVKVIVGGAPLTDLFAKKIGADGFGDNAPEAVKIVQSFLKGK